MIQTGHLNEGEKLNAAMFLEKYHLVCEGLNISSAKQDVLLYIHDLAELSVWDRDFFKSLASKFTFED